MDIAAGMEHLHSLGVLHVCTSHSQPARTGNLVQSQSRLRPFVLLCDGFQWLSRQSSFRIRSAQETWQGAEVA